jgi:hypothetical protein
MKSHHEYERFNEALKKVLTVSHVELKDRIEAAKRKPKTSASGRASRDERQKASS